MKTFKNLFIKDENEENDGKPKEQLAFPISESFNPTSPRSTGAANQYMGEIIEVYEKGLESINMPGYDFYDFYLVIKASGAENESVYKMAYQMGKALDKNLTSQKLAGDAEYYISKLNEVYKTYSDRGNRKLNALDSELRKEKEDLSNNTSRLESDISNLRQQIITLEQRLSETRTQLAQVEGKYQPQQQVIKLKLEANDHAMEISIQKLKSIRDGILKYIK